MKRKWFVVYVAAVLCYFSASGDAWAFSSFRFAVLSDPHLSVAGPDSPANGVKMFKDSAALLQSAINEINREKNIDFVLVLGDLTKDAEPWNVDRFKEVMDELRMPYYLILGNHDISPIDTSVRKKSPGVTRATMIWTFQGHGYQGPAENWSLDPVPGVHLVGLDSVMTGDWGGRLSDKAIAFLDRDLYANQGKLTIIMLHHQLQPYTRAAETGENDFNKFVLYNAGEVKELLSHYPQVAMTLSGHRHLSTRYKLENSIAYFTCPSTVTWPMRYVVFSVDNSAITYTTHDVPAASEVWEQARTNAFNVKVTQWPRTSETPDTPEGNRRLAKIMKAEDQKDGQIPLVRVMAASM